MQVDIVGIRIPDDEWNAEYDTPYDIFCNFPVTTSLVHSALYVAALNADGRTAVVAAVWRASGQGLAEPWDADTCGPALPGREYADESGSITSTWFNADDIFRFVPPRCVVLESDRAWGTQHGAADAARALAEDRPDGSAGDCLWLDLQTGAVQPVAADGSLLPEAEARDAPPNADDSGSLAGSPF